jgi:phosphatidate cytidylyltransferase
VTDATWNRLFSASRAFEHPVTVGLAAAVAGIAAVTPLAILALERSGKVTPELRRDLWSRYLSWLVLIPLIAGPVLLGAAWTIAAVAAMSLLCYREFARATGLFREKTVSLVVVLGIIAVNLAALDHWYELFVALFPLGLGAIAACAILRDEPRGYIQRVGLGFLGFSFFGACLGHLAYFANDEAFRPMLLLLVFCVQMNDVFAYVIGKTLGRRKLAPNTSPRKTVEGAAGALVLTGAMAALLGHFVFRGTTLDTPLRLAMLGLLLSATGQLGDLTLSSIKRDIGIKDMGVLLPGHGGILDRFNSFLLSAPTVFHFVGYYIGVGLSSETRIFTGGGP